MIGLIVPQIYSFFFPSVIKGIEGLIHSSGYNLLILQSNELYETEVENVNILLANNVEGILAGVSRKTENFDHFKNIINSNIPIVFFDRVPQNLQADMVLLDDITGAYKATKHLIESGREKIAICVGNPNLLISINRLKGYKNALADHGIPFRDAYVFRGQTPQEVEEKTYEILDLPEPPDSIFAISDLTMSGIMRAIYAKNVKVPDEVSIIGFCEEPFSTMYNPMLTSILPMGFKIGEIAAERLFSRIGKENEAHDIKPETIYVDSKLVVRGSTVDIEKRAK